MRIPEADVLVVGAGPVGLALACHLRRAGIDVRLVDKRARRSETSKAIGLQHRVSEVLARLGVAERFIELGGSPTTVRIYEGRRVLVTLRFSAPPRISGTDAFEPRPILLPQSDTERLLAELLLELGGTIEWNTEFLSCEDSGNGVVSELASADGSRTSIAARWLVSCEGAHSQIRRQLGLRFEGKTYPLAFLIVDARLDTDLDHGENHVWVSRGGSLAVLPLPSPATWRLFIDVTDLPATATSSELRTLVDRAVAERAPGLDLRIQGEPLWVSDFRINCRMVDPMQVGRMFLAGDAAHIHSPTGGQGITTGMQDAANLAWKLARVAAGAPESLLATYSEERVPHAREVLRETDRTTSWLLAPTPALRWVRDLVVLPVLRSPRLQRAMFGKFSQLHVHYRSSSLSRTQTAGAWSGLRRRGGDRAPDVSLLRAVDGSAVTLFELLRPQRPLVLLRGRRAGRLLGPLRSLQLAAFELAPHDTDRSVAGDDRLIDQYADFERLYGGGDDFLWLIRPDGHVGLVQRPIDPARLLAYLELLCEPRALASVDSVG